MAKKFDVDSGGIVNGKHGAIRGEDEIELTGHDTFVVHAYLDDVDCCRDLVGEGSCPLRFHAPMTVLATAELGEWQLGTNPDNDGRTGLTGDSAAFHPHTGNGTLKVGAG
jgi:hypothetical protein